jgi:hypothetical protein
LGYDQRHQGLSDCDDDPQPDPDRARIPEHVVVRPEDAHRDGDERERDREHLKRAERSFQLWFVAASTLFVRGLGVQNVFCRHPDTRPSSTS